MGRVAKRPVTFRRTVAAAATALALAAVAPVSAEATTACEYNGAAEVLNATMNADNDSTLLEIAAGKIEVRSRNGLIACSGGTATTANTTAINVFDNSSNGGTSLTLFDAQSFAALEVNDVPSDGRDSLTLFSSAAAAQFTVGTSGVNLDGDATREINLLGLPEEIELWGGSAADTLSARGGGNAGAVLNGPSVSLHGGAGADTLEGSEAGDGLEGEAGNDTIRGFGGNDSLTGDVLAGFGSDTYDGGAGTDTVSYPLVFKGVTVDLAKSGPQETGDGNDTFSEIENLRGSAFADTLLGTSGPNSIEGEGGDDIIDGRGGNDTLRGSSGTDTVTYAGAPAGVVVDLGAGTASGGYGTDSATEFENLIGSPFADSLTGSAAANAITGLGGVDVVKALGGPDRVDVRDGGPDHASCGSEVDTAVADSLSVDTIEPDCEQVELLVGPGDGGAGGGTAGGTGGGATVGAGGNSAGAKDTKVTFLLHGAARQRLLVQRGLILKLRCPLEACTVSIGASGRLPRLPGAAASAKRRLQVKPRLIGLPAGPLRNLRLPLSKRALGLIEAALDQGKRPKLRVTATAKDAAGNSAPAHLTVTAKP